MDRRGVLKVLGGGVIVAATAGGLAGCSTALPPEAVRAWNGPGEQPDVRRWILAHAILAPHSHNLQSWLVDLREPGVIGLRMDLTRLLPETDPQSRQLVMGQGTFLEVLDLAARERGLRADIVLFPEGAFAPDQPDARPTARITLVPDVTVRPDPLFRQVFARHTNRGPYDVRPPAADALTAIAAATAGFPVRTGFSDPGDTATLQRHRMIAADAWRIEFETPRTQLESLKVLRVGPTEIARHRDGLVLNTPMARLLTATGLFDRSRAAPPDSYAVRSQIDAFRDTLAATPAFFWMVTPDNARTTQVQAGRAYVRAQLAATAQGLSMHPLSQALQEFPEVAGPYRQIHELVGATPGGGTVQMWARLGYGPVAGPSPRRGLESHIVAG